MAYQIGTATDHLDLYEKLIEFLTNDPDLVYDGQNWEIAWAKETDPAGGIVLKGPGLATTDEIFVGMQLNANIPDDNAAITIVGMTGVIDSSTDFKDHVNVTPVGTRMMLRTQAMDYWFVANGRRFMAMARVSTVYESLYAGFFLPYSAPTQYPYPMFIGGCAHDATDRETVASWRSTTESHAHFTRSTRNTLVNSNGHPANAWMLDPSGNWLDVGISSSSDALCGPGFFGSGFGIASGFGTANYGYNTIINRAIPGYGDEHALIPITLLQESPNDQTFGVLDGVYRVGGRGNAPENTIVAEGVTHVVGINTFRTGIADFWAMEIGVVP
jgi:hypothetical protein